LTHNKKTYTIRTVNNTMKTYATPNARNAVKAAQVTNHIKAGKKVGLSHAEAKAEAYRMYQIKKGQAIILKKLKADLA
jgi:hypothetical protein